MPTHPVPSAAPRRVLHVLMLAAGRALLIAFLGIVPWLPRQTGYQG